MYYVYILESNKTGRHYIGSTEDIAKRLRRHNEGRNVSTKGGLWKLVFSESCANKHSAYRREMEIKRYKGGRAFKNLLNSAMDTNRRGG